MLALSYTELLALNPCPDSLRRVAKLMGGAKKWRGIKIDATQARTAGCTFDDLVWVASAASRTDDDVERRLRLWLADCAARVLCIYERAYPSDTRPREAIIASRAYARGECRAAAWDAARAAAWDAAWDAVGAAAWDVARAAAGAAAWDAEWAAAGAAAWDAEWAAAWAAARAAAWDAAGDAAWDAARVAAWDAARDAERGWQLDRLVAWLSDPEPEDWPLPAAKALAKED